MPFARLAARVAARTQHLWQPGTPAWHGPPMPQRRPVLPLLEIQLAGDQAAMGAQHGEALRGCGGHEATLDWYPGMANRIAVGPHEHPAQAMLPHLVDPVTRRLLARLDAARPADLRARSRAFFAALGRDPAEARTLGVMDVLQNLIGLGGRLGVPQLHERWSALVPGACSTLAVWDAASADGRLLLGRNFDFPGAGVWESAPVVAFCTPAHGLRYGFVATRGADAPCVSVWNEAGLVATIHTRFHQAVRFDARLAVDLMHDVIRRARTLQEAITIVREAPVASTWGIVLASGPERRAVLVEVHGQASAVVEPNAGEAFLACTNRYQAPALHAGELEPTPGWIMHSDGRHLALRREAGRALAQGGMTVERLCATLGSHEDPDVDGLQRAAGGVLAQPNGVQSVVVDPERQCTWVSVGAVPTGHGPWLEVPWRWDVAPGVRELDVAALREAHLQDATAPGWRYRSGPLGEAYGHLLEAARLEMGAGPLAQMAESLEAACRLAPEEPTWRLLAGGLALRRGDLTTGTAHLEAGLATEPSPFFRARLLLWAARAADAAGGSGKSLRRDLVRLAHPRIGRYVAAAHAEDTRPWTPARARRTHVAVQLCDLG